MKLLTLDAAAEALGLKPKSLADRRFRVRIGLPVVKIGRRIMFDERDLEKVVAQGREHLPMKAG